jgi:hypothetical protein
MNFKYILMAIFVLAQLSASYAGVESITEGPHTARQSLLLSLCGDLQQEILTKWLDDDVKSRATLDTACTNTVDRAELEKVCKELVAVSLLFDKTIWPIWPYGSIEQMTESRESQYTSLDQIINYIDRKYKNINKLKIRFSLLKRIDPQTISKIKSLQINFNIDDLDNINEFSAGKQYEKIEEAIEEATVEAIEEESLLLSSAANLEEFTLWCWGDIYDYILPILENIPQTTTKISLIGDNLSGSYDRKNIKALCSYAQITELHVLSGFLYPQDFDEKNSKVALKNFKFLTREFSKLVKLRSLTIHSLFGNSLFSGFTVNNGMLDFLRNNSVVEKLNLESVFVSENSLANILSCPNLKELTLSYLTVDELDMGADNAGYDILTPEKFIKILNGSQISGDLILTIYSTSAFPKDSFDSLSLRFPKANVIVGEHINY